MLTPQDLCRLSHVCIGIIVILSAIVRADCDQIKTQLLNSILIATHYIALRESNPLIAGCVLGIITIRFLAVGTTEDLASLVRAFGVPLTLLYSHMLAFQYIDTTPTTSMTTSTTRSELSRTHTTCDLVVQQSIVFATETIHRSIHKSVATFLSDDDTRTRAIDFGCTLLSELGRRINTPENVDSIARITDNIFKSGSHHIVATCQSVLSDPANTLQMSRIKADLRAYIDVCGDDVLGKISSDSTKSILGTLLRDSVERLVERLDEEKVTRLVCGVADDSFKILCTHGTIFANSDGNLERVSVWIKDVLMSVVHRKDREWYKELANHQITSLCTDDNLKSIRKIVDIVGEEIREILDQEHNQILVEKYTTQLNDVFVETVKKQMRKALE